MTNYALSVFGMPDVYIDFRVYSTSEVSHDPLRMQVLWCDERPSTMTKREEPLDIGDWFDDHGIYRDFEINGDGIYTVDDARKIWRGLVNRHDMEPRKTDEVVKSDRPIFSTEWDKDLKSLVELEIEERKWDTDYALEA